MNVKRQKKFRLLYQQVAEEESSLINYLGISFITLLLEIALSISIQRINLQIFRVKNSTKSEIIFLPSQGIIIGVLGYIIYLALLVNYDKIQGVAVLRNRRRSDKLKPVGQAHTRELRKLLQERLPREERAVSAVIEDELGIVWAEHAGFADRVKADENTENYLVIEITRSDIG